MCQRAEKVIIRKTACNLERVLQMKCIHSKNSILYDFEYLIGLDDHLSQTKPIFVMAATLQIRYCTVMSHFSLCFANYASFLQNELFVNLIQSGRIEAKYILPTVSVCLSVLNVTEIFGYSSFGEELLTSPLYRMFMQRNSVAAL
jgi:hypothetical protein